MQLLKKRDALFVLQTGFGAVLCCCALWVAVRTLHWPLRGDCALIHYAVLLLDSGSKPYVDFRDVNLPGAYLLDWLVMHTLGAGAMGERIYDLGLCGAALLAMLALTPPKLRFAGWFAGVLFFLVHMRDGARHTGQRDLSIAVLLLVGFAFSFAALRVRRRWLHLAAGAMLGMACIVKPVAMLFAIPLLIGPCSACWVSVALLVAGILAPIGMMTVWLAHEGVLRAFLATALPMVAYHASLDHKPWRALLSRGLTPVASLVVAAVVLTPFLWKRLHGRELGMLIGAVAAGALYFLLQGKGYAYQRYPMMAFLLLVLGWIFVSAMQEEGWPRYLAVGAVAGGCLVIAPLSVRKAVRYMPERDQFGEMLTQDLQRLGGDRLDGRVQCLDTFSGCIRVLYGMRLRQSTGALYDEFLFSRQSNAAIDANRTAFLRELEARPAEVVILTPQFYSDATTSYTKVTTWPAFEQYLEAHYVLDVERTPVEAEHWEGAPRVPEGYRIYLRRDMELGGVPVHSAEVE